MTLWKTCPRAWARRSAAQFLLHAPDLLDDLRALVEQFQDAAIDFVDLHRGTRQFAATPRPASSLRLRISRPSIARVNASSLLPSSGAAPFCSIDAHDRTADHHAIRHRATPRRAPASRCRIRPRAANPLPPHRSHQRSDGSDSDLLARDAGARHQVNEASSNIPPPARAAGPCWWAQPERPCRDCGAHCADMYFPASSTLRSVSRHPSIPGAAASLASLRAVSQHRVQIGEQQHRDFRGVGSRARSRARGERGSGVQRALRRRAGSPGRRRLGSEKGTPSSIRSAPPRSSAATSAGSPVRSRIASRDVSDQRLAARRCCMPVKQRANARHSGCPVP